MARATNTGAVRLFFLAATAAVGANPDASVGDSDTNTVVVKTLDPDVGKKLSIDTYAAVGGMALKPSDKEVEARRNVKEIWQEAKEDNARTTSKDHHGRINKKKSRSKRNMKKVKRILSSEFQSAIAANFVQNTASESSTMVVRGGSSSWNTGWNTGWQDPWHDPWSDNTGWYEGSSKSSKVSKVGDDWYDEGWHDDGWLAYPWKGDDWVAWSASGSKSDKTGTDDWWAGDHHNDWDTGWGTHDDWNTGWGNHDDWNDGWSKGQNIDWGKNRNRKDNDWNNGWSKGNDWGSWGKDKDWDNGWGKDKDWNNEWGKDKRWNSGGGKWNDWSMDKHFKTYPPTLSPTMSPTFYPTFYPTLSPTLAPTVTPTWTPTFSPTLTPTIGDPTFTPTYSPTYLPTMFPTISPTLFPTIAPTIIPTLTPTISPTGEPTYYPTMTPTTCPAFEQRVCCMSGSRFECFELGCNLNQCKCTPTLIRACCETGLNGNQQGKCLDKLGCTISKCKQSGKIGD
mmetsp:Transcript_25339/g.50761  ORF Transcript_25339/g.50761 Transcript_25339/m.50761 type:complete len:508 (+) Transcript_25339:63-1586(+)